MDSSMTAELFLIILRSAITGKTVELPEDLHLYIDEILSLARTQDVYALICQGIKNNKGTLPKAAVTKVLSELYRYKQNECMLVSARRILSASKIPFIPLKGAVVQNLYPEQWMRSSCDIDILVEEKDLEKAVSVLAAAGFVTNNEREYHDISLYYGNAHLELHFNICENLPRIDRVLIQVWDNLEIVSGYEFRETPAFFAFHHIAHMLYHFLRGGCNIKQYVDLWLLKQNHFYKEEDLRPFLKKSRLEDYKVNPFVKTKI